MMYRAVWLEAGIQLGAAGPRPRRCTILIGAWSLSVAAPGVPAAGVSVSSRRNTGVRVPAWDYR